MQTLSLFPNLFDYSFLAIGVLRITLGLIFIWFAYTKVFHERRERIAFFQKLGMKPAFLYFVLINGVEGIAGVLLVAGLYTQPAALTVGILMTLATLIKLARPSSLPQNTAEFYLLLAVVSFVLMSIGPGAWAFDLPL